MSIVSTSHALAIILHSSECELRAALRVAGRSRSVVDGLTRCLEHTNSVALKALAADPSQKMLHALKRAEEFMSGFEGDQAQETLEADLALVRGAIEAAETPLVLS